MSYTFENTPTSPDFAMNWDAIAEFPWIAAMSGVQQEPEWHAEGDVFTHTRMVAAAMAALDAWRARPETDRHILFAAALLHDVAKPQCTRFDEGRWTSPKHAKVGEGVSRHLLWTGQAGGDASVVVVRQFQAAPNNTVQAGKPASQFTERERIAKLVRYHGLPLRFMDKPDPARAIILASLEVNLRDVADLALADVIGRECAGKEQLVQSVRLFTEYATELECLDQSKRFEHDHHRFSYCVARKPLEYVPHVPKDADAFEVTLMSGLPGSGKSTVAKRLAGERPLINLDEIRGRLEIDGGDDQSPVIAEAKEQAKALLRARQSFVWDATNVTKDMRSGLIALFANYGATTRIVYVEAPTWQEMFARNRNRERPVPEKVIVRLAEKIEIPSASEAHRVEWVAC